MMIGKIIRKQRLQRGLSTADLAKKMNVQRNSVERWEKNQVTPRINTIFQLEHFFYMEPGSLLSILDLKDNTDKKIYVVVAPNYDTKIDKICRTIIKKHPNYVIFTPRNTSSYYPKEWDRNLVFQQHHSSLIFLSDEVWTFGDWRHSNECRLNIHFAGACKLKIVHEPLLF